MWIIYLSIPGSGGFIDSSGATNYRSSAYKFVDREAAEAWVKSTTWYKDGLLLSICYTKVS